MITQAIKRWLHKMFAWWPWKTAPETDYAPVTTPIHKGITQNIQDIHNANNAIPWSTTEGVAPQSGVTPLIFGQGEGSRSTIGEWPERVVQSSPLANEKNEPPSPLLPTIPPVEQTIDSDANNTSIEAKAIYSDAPPTPTPEQQLEFLSYLVRRGLVNEGFPEGQVPEQYRKK
ncbi:MAG TPA: hypothetical protein VKU38_07960 [Ktedonobacteraceae bacterium]|nr:hypothetical protein [Ktedonobacteraceae bacterium]